MAEVRRIHKIREAIPAKEGGSGEYPSIARTGEGKRRKRRRKEEGRGNNPLELIAADPSFNLTLEELQKTMQPEKYTGRAAIQVEHFVNDVVNPVLERNKDLMGVKEESNV